MREPLTHQQGSENSRDTSQRESEQSRKEQSGQRAESLVSVPESKGSFHVDSQMLAETDHLVVSDSDSGEVYFDSNIDRIDPLLGLEVPFELGESQQLSVTVEGAVSIQKSMDRVHAQFQNLGWVVNSSLRKPEDPGSLVETTELRADFRATTVSDFNATIACDTVVDASAYEFLFEAPGGFFTTAETEHSNGELNLVHLFDLEPNNTYSVRIKALVNGQWGNYGPAHNLSTPDPVPCLWLRDEDRNMVIRMNQQIYATPITPATQTNVRWKAIHIVEGTEHVYTRSTGSRNYAPYYMTNERYETNYCVQVAAFVGGVWGEYGPSRMFRIEDFPLTKLADASVGHYTSLNIYLNLDAVLSMKESRWECVATDGSISTIYHRTHYSPAVLMTWLRIPYDKTYMIRVQVNVGDVWNDFGEARQISLGPIPTTSLSDANVGLIPDQGLYVYCASVGGASDYDWRFTATDSSHTVSRERNHYSANIYLGWLRLHYGKSYDVDIRVENDGIWGDWGPTKRITIGTVTTHLHDSLHETTLVTQGIYAQCIGKAGATDYEWHFAATDGSHTVSRERNHYSSNFYLGWVYLHYGKTYEIKIRIENGGTWGDWGPVRQLTVPVEQTKLRDSDVGLQLNQGRYLYCDGIPGITDYEWRFTATDGSHTNSRERNHYSTNMFLAWLRLHFGKTYNVEIRAENAGIFGDWGEVRQITVPVETTELRSDYVGTTLTNPAVYLHPEPIWAITDSEWEFSATDGSHTAIRKRGSYTLNMYAGYFNLLSGKTYDVRIRVENAGIWGDWGPTRQIDTNFP